MEIGLIRHNHLIGRDRTFLYWLASLLLLLLPVSFFLYLVKMTSVVNPNVSLDAPSSSGMFIHFFYSCFSFRAFEEPSKNKVPFFVNSILNDEEEEEEEEGWGSYVDLNFFKNVPNSIVFFLSLLFSSLLFSSLFVSLFISCGDLGVLGGTK